MEAEMENDIINYLEQYNFSYVKIDREQDIIDVHEAYFTNVFKDNVSAIVNNYYGIYHRIKEDFELMIKYYLLAIEQKSITSMINLGRYYKNIKDYDNMVKYYTMAADLGDSSAMNSLAIYYEEIGDYNTMIKYYLLAIELGDDIAMYNLALYYYKIKDCDNMVKYLLQAIDNENVLAMCDLGYYYEENKDYDNMIKYYSMAVDLGDEKARHNLAAYYYNSKDYHNAIKYYLPSANQLHLTDESGRLPSVELKIGQDISNLAAIYREIGDNDNFIKYSLLAIELGKTAAMTNLGFHYRTIKDYDNMFKYHMMAIELGEKLSMFDLGIYYVEIKDYDNAIKYLIMAANLKLIAAMTQLVRCYALKGDHSNTKKYLLLLITENELSCVDILLDKFNDPNILLDLFVANEKLFNNEKYVDKIINRLIEVIKQNGITIDLIAIIEYIDLKYFFDKDKLLLAYKQLLMEKINLLDLHFNYSPDGQGYKQAKEDFIERII